MMHQEFTLDRWGWRVAAFYEIGADEAPALIQLLKDAGCSGGRLRTAARTLETAAPNFGLTYSNYRARESVMIIGKTTSAREFADSYDHEKGHLAKHICQALRIGPWGEEAEYLAGAISKQTFPVASRLMCEHCRRKRQ